MPENTQASKYENPTPGREVSKDRILALLCASADGSYKLTPVIVGKTHKPRVLKNIMTHLPVLYDNSKKAWLNVDWFLKGFVPEVRKFQGEELGIPAEDANCLLHSDNALAHPSKHMLCSEDGKFRCTFLPKNIAHCIQPMDLGIILATK